MENLNEKQQIEEMAKAIDDIASNAYIENYDEAIADADKIAEALYNANYRKQEWISVEDRLPEKSGDYLTYHEHGSCGVIYYNADIKLWNVYYSDDVRNAIRSITHWMPFPEAPKMKGENDGRT